MAICPFASRDIFPWQNGMFCGSRLKETKIVWVDSMGWSFSPSWEPKEGSDQFRKAIQGVINKKCWLLDPSCAPQDSNKISRTYQHRAGLVSAWLHAANGRTVSVFYYSLIPQHNKTKPAVNMKLQVVFNYHSKAQRKAWNLLNLDLIFSKLRGIRMSSDEMNKVFLMIYTYTLLGQVYKVGQVKKQRRPRFKKL